MHTGSACGAMQEWRGTNLLNTKAASAQQNTYKVAKNSHTKQVSGLNQLTLFLPLL